MNNIIDHYVDQHTAAFPGFAGTGLPWLDSQRKSGISRFRQSGFPAQQEEDWRYTSLRPITGKLFQVKVDDQLAQTNVSSHLIPGLDSYRLVFVDGRFAPDQSSISGLASKIVVNSFARLLELDPGVICTEPEGEFPSSDGFATLNIAFSQDGYLVQIPDGVKLDKPLEVIFIAAGSELVAQPRNIIRLGKFAEANVIERHVSAEPINALVNSTSRIVLDQGARLEYYLLQSRRSSTYQVSSVDASLAKDSSFSSCAVSLGGELVRNNLTIRLNQPGAHCDMFGLYNISGRQHVDNHTNVIHAAEHCTSRELYKGVLGERSKAVFHGRIKVEPDAQKTDASQANNNLLLSANAEIVTKPQLEIYADDVKCAHGATIGQLDQNSLFYLRSRGIDEIEARLLLTRAFVSDVLREITIEPLRKYLESTIAPNQIMGDELQ